MNDKMKLREKIISLLKKKGSLYLGDITMEIQVSPQSGYQFIEELMEEGIVKHQPDSLKITLAWEFLDYGIAGKAWGIIIQNLSAWRIPQADRAGFLGALLKVFFLTN